MNYWHREDIIGLICNYDLIALGALNSNFPLSILDINQLEVFNCSLVNLYYICFFQIFRLKKNTKWQTLIHLSGSPLFAHNMWIFLFSLSFFSLFITLPGTHLCSEFCQGIDSELIRTLFSILSPNFSFYLCKYFLQYFRFFSSF